MLERDGFRCVITKTGLREHEHPREDVDANLDAVHIIPFALGLFGLMNDVLAEMFGLASIATFPRARGHQSPG